MSIPPIKNEINISTVRRHSSGSDINLTNMATTDLRHHSSPGHEERGGNVTYYQVMVKVIY